MKRQALLLDKQAVTVNMMPLPALLRPSCWRTQRRVGARHLGTSAGNTEYLAKCFIFKKLHTANFW